MRLRRINWLALAALILVAMPSGAGAWPFSGGNQPPVTDTFQALINAAGCTNCWVDLGSASVATANTYQSQTVPKSCPSSPNLVDMGSDGPGAVFGSWSAGTYDTDHKQMLMFGGGHANYAGNEVYALHLPTITWEMLTCPSAIAGFTNGNPTYPDGLPVSRHTYGGNSFRPGEGLITTGGSPWNLGQCSRPETWLFNPTSKTWSQKGNIGLANCGDITAYNSSDGKTYFIGPDNANASIESYSGGTWTTIGTNNTGMGNVDQNGEIDPTNGEFIGAGSNGSGGTLDKVVLSTGVVTFPLSTGSEDCINALNPGFSNYGSHKFVSWCGGNLVDTIDTSHAGTSGDPMVWTQHAGTCSGITGGCATLPAANVTGDWKSVTWLPDYKVLIVITLIANHVYAYIPNFS